MLNNERYSCQVKLPGFGASGQSALKDACVLIVGMGGLGCPAALYLAASGIGTLGIADYDTVSIGNLHRQVLFGHNDVGQKKVSIATEKLKLQNPDVCIIQHQLKVSADNIMSLIQPYDVIIDATDNFETRYLLNDACVISRKPLIYGALYQYEGQVAVWNIANDDGTYSPNFRDVFPSINILQVPDCTEGGVIGTLAGIVGCMQATEAIKLITGVGKPLKGQLLIVDSSTMQTQLINIRHTTNTNIKNITPNHHVLTVSKKEIALKRGNDNVLIVDVRNTDEHTACNIGGINIPLSELEQSLDRFLNKSEIIFYCTSGKRSEKAARWLMGKNINVQVASLENGINS